MIWLISIILYLWPIIYVLLESVYSQHKNKKQQIRGIIWQTWCKHWTREQFLRSRYSLTVRLVLCWNLTITQVTKLIRYSNKLVLAWLLVFDLSLWHKTNQITLFKKRLFLVSSFISFLMVQGEYWFEVITMKKSKCSLLLLLLL